MQYCLSNYLLGVYRVTDMGTLSWLNVETLERSAHTLFSRLVKCSARGYSFAKLLYGADF